MSDIEDLNTQALVDLATKSFEEGMDDDPSIKGYNDRHAERLELLCTVIAAMLRRRDIDYAARASILLAQAFMIFEYEDGEDRLV